jgi:hypothetical protein
MHGTGTVAVVIVEPVLFLCELHAGIIKADNAIDEILINFIFFF